jgi:hypothetical protein
MVDIHFLSQNALKNSVKLKIFFAGAARTRQGSRPGPD